MVEKYKKTCTGCGKEKLLKEFPIKKEMRDGRHSHCRECRNKYHSKYRKSERGKETQKRFKLKDIRKYRKYHAEYERKRRKTEEFKLYSIEYEKKEERRISRRLRQRKRNIKLSKNNVTTKDILNLLEIQNRKCFYCGCELVDYQIDHFIPLSKGGEHIIENIVIACISCNLSKNDKMPMEFAYG